VPPKPELTGQDLKISDVIPPEAEEKGIWIISPVLEHAFFAKVNIEPAQNPNWELGQSRIPASKFAGSRTGMLFSRGTVDR
jgi:hypothetical protein